jgi:integrase
MARPKSQVPSLRHHISGQAVCQIDGVTFYLGKYQSPESLARYALLIREYQANGLAIPEGLTSQKLKDLTEGFQTGESLVVHQEDTPVLLVHVTAAYRAHAKQAYANSKAELYRIQQICDELDQVDGKVRADEYGPKTLKRQRDLWVASGKARPYCNRLTRMVVRMFGWAVSEELVSESTWTRLKSVEPLREGRTSAPERDPRKPVDIGIVRKTAKELSPVLRAMVRLQVATGMRPSELCTMRPCDIDRTGSDWIYRPAKHKNKSKGKPRAIPIVGDAREAITDYLNRDPGSYCFSPAESVAWWQVQKRATRKSKVQPSQRDRSKSDPSVKPGEHYTQDSYRRAIHRACIRAGVESWFPYQLRHLNLTQVRDALGVEYAQAIGGHSRVDMTQVYAQISERKAIEAAKHAPTLGLEVES